MFNNPNNYILNKLSRKIKFIYVETIQCQKQRVSNTFLAELLRKQFATQISKKDGLFVDEV